MNTHSRFKLGESFTFAQHFTTASKAKLRPKAQFVFEKIWLW